MRSVRFALVTMGLLGCVGSGAYAQQASPVTLRQIAIEGAFAGKKAGDAATDISGMAEMTTGKAEGVTVLDATVDKAQIVILFDDLLDGAPHRSEISIPKRK
jgi:hypothetical protein